MMFKQMRFFKNVLALLLQRKPLNVIILRTGICDHINLITKINEDFINVISKWDLPLKVITLPNKNNHNYIIKYHLTNYTHYLTILDFLIINCVRIIIVHFFFF
jgi:hypothetical protein